MKTIYYSDEINEDFANTGIKTIPLTPKFKYFHKSILWKIGEFIIFRGLAQPLVSLYTKIWFHQTFANKEVIEPFRHKGLYLYGNHTSVTADSFIPVYLHYAKKNYAIAGPDSMSIPCIRWLVEMVGVIPLPSTMSQTKDFQASVHDKIKRNKSVSIFPEAHVWPYYTKIRNFPENSFRFPAQDGAPVFALTECYQKRRFGKRPRIVTYIDGPFYRDENLSLKQNMKKLRNECYAAMVDRTSKYSTCEYIHYEKRTTPKD
ncbi:MAG: 1-acyl-sn-glycerol-3-phosphate acyltransferase [Treponema sp.]|nr:1-acyl-sn-glycerol-3-phosphate acyltransferase [Treponema sp.]